MTLRTLILSGFSIACLGVAVLGYQSQERRAEALELVTASLAPIPTSDCMTTGFETSEGFVGCLQPASYVLDGSKPSRIQFFIDEVAYVLGL